MLSEQNDRPHGLVARLQGVLGFNNGERPSEGLTLWFRSFVNELEDAHARIRSRIDAVNAETNAELDVFQEKMRKTLQAEEVRAEAEIVTSLRATVQKSIQEFESAVDVSGKKIIADFEQLAREKCGEATNDVAAVRSEIVANAEKLRAEATDQLGITRQRLEVLRSEVGARADHVRDEVGGELGNVQQGLEKLRAVRVQFLLDEEIGG